MANLVTNANEFAYVNSGESAIAAGTPIVASKLFGVATAPIAVGQTGWIKTDGVWDIAGTTSETASVGDIAYWDASNSKVTTTASTNLPIGYFVKAKASADTTVRIILGVKVQAAAAAQGGGT